MLFYRKVFIIFIIRYYHWKKEIKLLTLLFVFFMSLWIEAKQNPFLTYDLNSFGFKASLILLGTLFGGFFFYESKNQAMEIFLLIAIFCINVYFLFVWAKKILTLKIHFFANRKKYFSRFMVNIIENLQNGIVILIILFLKP